MMGIADNTPGNQFNQAVILQNAPNASGVYALYTAQRWVYVGESNDIQRRLLEHLNEQGTCIKQQGATGFAFELVAAQTRVARQNDLIRQLRPACNQMMG